VIFNKTSWIVKTNQEWKIILSGVVIFLATPIFFADEIAPRFFEVHLPDFNVFLLYGMALAAVALLWIGFSIRCPVCRKNIGGYMVSTYDWRSWFTTLVSMESCPRCGK
jgi:hypothetical protein